MITPLKNQWQGVYYDGRSPVRHEAEITLLDDDLLVELAKVGFRQSYDEVILAQGEYSGEPIRLEFGGEGSEALVVDDRAFLSALRQRTELSSRQFAETPLTRIGFKQTLVAATGVIALIAGFYLWGAQVLGNGMAALVPASWEERLGKSVMPWVAGDEDLCLDVDKRKAVDAIAERLVAALPERRYDYVFLIAKGPVNALTVPGGRIVIFDGLLKMTETPEQLAGVLAHEIQHAHFRHTTRSMFRNMTMQALLAAVTGDASGGVGAFESVTELGVLAHQRSEEEEADREGVALMAAANIDPIGMVEIFDKFGEVLPDGPYSMLSTHPTTESRIERLRERIAELEFSPEPFKLATSWKSVAKPCRVKGD